MRILINIEPENVFERTPLLRHIKTFFRNNPQKLFRIKKLEIRVLDKGEKLKL